MKLEEIKTIVNRLDPYQAKNVRIQVYKDDGSGFNVYDIESFCFMNGDLVFTVNSPEVRNNLIEKIKHM